ncbi:MAG: hypothetical protein JOZ41_04130, partial [Chloroflexi bacterium]|nr:hypothetical protein [Chloroflexota bacterium]
MAKHKRSGRKGRQNPPRPSTLLDKRKLGLQAFRAGRFDETIATWSALPEKDARIVVALAEAHFRRALTRPAGDEQVADLRQAIALAPDERRYRYHLGLALHRAGDLPGAIQCYRAVMQRDGAHLAAAAGMMLALAALEQDGPVDLSALPSSTPEVSRTLVP